MKKPCASWARLFFKPIQMSKPEYKSVVIKLDENNNVLSGTVTLPKGVQVHCGVTKSNGAIPVRITLMENSNNIHDPLNQEWFDGKQGSFKQRALELKTQGGNEVEVKVESYSPIAAGQSQLVEATFLITKENATC